MPDSIQLIPVRLVPQPGEIWEVITPCWWHKYSSNDHLSYQAFLLNPGDRFIVQAIDHQSDRARIMWFHDQGWIFFQNIPDHCVRVNTWDREDV